MIPPNSSPFDYYSAFLFTSCSGLSRILRIEMGRPADAMSDDASLFRPT